MCASLIPAVMNLTGSLLVLLSVVYMADGALWQFGKMIVCAQPGATPLSYSDYGCWCGFGGRGEPVDGVDRCCKVHDDCYKASRLAPGCTAIVDLPYVLVYENTCNNQQVICSASNNKCQAAACECDRAAAHCFAQSSYNPEHKGLDPRVHCTN